ncbi:MAG: glucose 1-dehydrogenase [Caldilineales bacterium]|nr:glucose 1-dehydrogenase [Caldilineales bacterium]
MNPNPSFDLTGKTAIITGASRGIGEAIARAYAGAGACVVLSSRKLEGLEEVAASIRAAGGQALAIAAHTGDSEAIANLVATATREFGGVDILVNNAATNPHFGPLLAADEGQWDKILDVNVKGYFRLVRACVPEMRRRGGGKIINMASVAGLKPQPMMGVYSVSKAAVLMLTQALAMELAGENVQVNAIAPGFVKTKFSSALWANQSFHDAIVKTVPQQRMADAGEIIGIALYLASPASSFTTGAVFVVDGGQLVGHGIQL